MKILQYSQEPKFYWTALPALLAASAGMSWDQFIASQSREKHRLFETLFKRANLQNAEGGRTLAAVLAHMMLEMNAYMEVPIDVAVINARAILEEAAMIIEEIVDQANAQPVEGPRIVEASPE